MINIELVPKNFLPKPIDNIDAVACSYYGILTGTIHDKSALILPPHKLGEALAYAVKLNLPMYKTDEASYEKFKSTYLESVKDSNEHVNLGGIDDLIEDDLKLADFLRHSADLLSNEESAPVIKFVNSLFYQAIKKSSSDIHIEAKENFGEVRFRIDGALHEYVKIDKNFLAPVISRIKIISHLDISEKRIPQDGRTQVVIAGKTLDVRVSAIPTYYGERIVMRILSHSSDAPSLDMLGFSPSVVKELEKILSYSYGVFLVTGPTGSGKSTTLHACLRKITDSTKNLMSIEDPVEYKSDGVNQIQVNEKVGLTFAAGLRSILRQDPDIVMVGEIRDPETAKIAVQAALTGHLTLSTLHTNDSVSAIARLIDMGVENYLLLSSLLGVLAQRLVRILCNDCKQESKLSGEIAQLLGLSTDQKVYNGVGCEKCNHTGYVGRAVICELFILDSETRSFIKDNPTTHQIKDYVKNKNFKTLLDDINQMVREGKTSPSEAVRVGVMEI